MIVKRFRFKTLLMSLALLLIFFGNANTVGAGADDLLKIRVGLIQNATSVDITIQGNYRLINQKNGSVITTTGTGSSWRINLGSADIGGGIYVIDKSGNLVNTGGQGLYVIGSGGRITQVNQGLIVRGFTGYLNVPSSGLSLYQNGYPAGSFEGPVVFQEISHSSTNLITVNGIKYRGNMEFRIYNNKITVVNELPLEEYLYGVVPKEMPSYWPMEALKAQAVAARCYAVKSLEIRRYEGFDVLPTDQDQVYGGYSAETSSTNQAVDATSKKVMVAGDSIIDAYFHSHSGGYTEYAENVWGSPVSYLKAVDDSGSMSAGYTDKNTVWTEILSPDDIKTKLAARGIVMLTVSGMDISEITPGGRVKTLIIRGLPTDQYIVTTDKVRIYLGLKSAKFNITNNNLIIGGTVTLNGYGWGHGLGMPQWGAKYKADTGNTYDQILKYYYTGVEIKDNYNR